jgi:hypothetical protein
MSGDWWLTYDARQDRRTRELEAGLESATATASANRRRLAQVAGTLDQKIVGLANALETMLELFDIREELDSFADAAMARRHVRNLLVSMGTMSPKPPVGGVAAVGVSAAVMKYTPRLPDDVAGYWIVPAVAAFVALNIDEADDASLTTNSDLAVARERDLRSTDQFLVVLLLLTGRAKQFPSLVRAALSIGAPTTGDLSTGDSTAGDSPTGDSHSNAIAVSTESSTPTDRVVLVRASSSQESQEGKGESSATLSAFGHAVWSAAAAGAFGQPGRHELVTWIEEQIGSVLAMGSEASLRWEVSANQAIGYRPLDQKVVGARLKVFDVPLNANSALGVLADRAEIAASRWHENVVTTAISDATRLELQRMLIFLVDAGAPEEDVLLHRSAELRATLSDGKGKAVDNASLLPLDPNEVTGDFEATMRSKLFTPNSDASDMSAGDVACWRGARHLFVAMAESFLQRATTVPTVELAVPRAVGLFDFSLTAGSIPEEAIHALDEDVKQRYPPPNFIARIGGDDNAPLRVTAKEKQLAEWDRIRAALLDIETRMAECTRSAAVNRDRVHTVASHQ